jgi:hypothetical protein
VPLAMSVNFFTGSKRMFFTPAFMIVLAYIVYERRIRASWVVAGLAALVALYPLSNFYRATVQSPYGSRMKIFLQDPGGVLRNLAIFTGSAEASTYFSSGIEATGVRLDGLNVLTAIVKDTPERVPYQDGRTIGLIFVSFIPRLVWPGKPGITIGEWVAQSYGSAYDLTTDVGPTWIGEFYFNWGYAGVVFGMFALGIQFRMLQERLFSWNAPIPALFAAVNVLYIATRSVQGGLIDPISGPLVAIVPIVATHFLVGLFGGFQRVPARVAGSPPGPPAS